MNQVSELAWDPQWSRERAPTLRSEYLAACLHAYGDARFYRATRFHLEMDVQDPAVGAMILCRGDGLPMGVRLACNAINIDSRGFWNDWELLFEPLLCFATPGHDAPVADCFLPASPAPTGFRAGAAVCYRPEVPPDHAGDLYEALGGRWNTRIVGQVRRFGLSPNSKYLVRHVVDGSFLMLGASPVPIYWRYCVLA